MKQIVFFLSSFLMTLSVVNAQDYFHEYFNDGGLQWTNIDGDGDGYAWRFVSFYPDYGHGKLVNSESYNWSTALTPNNYLISPAIVLGSNNLQLQYDVKGHSRGITQEHYAVYVTTANDTATINAATPLLEETLPAHMTHSVLRTIDISAFSGQTIYVTFRHFNVTNMCSIDIDNVFVGKYTNLSLESVNNSITATPGNIIIEGTVRNRGSNTLTSIEISYDDGSGPVSEMLTGLNIASGATYDFSFTAPYNLTPGANVNLHVCATVAGDEDTSNDCIDKPFLAVSSSLDRHFVVEENTGTWCGWCPRGTVALDYLHKNDPMTIGISIHCNDPMEVKSYNDSCIANFPHFIGFPNSAIDRVIGDHMSKTSIYVNQRKVILPPGGISFDEAILEGNTIIIKPKIAMVANMTGQYGLAVVITEDSVKGIGPDWLQHNYYSSTEENENLIDVHDINWKNLPGKVDQCSLFGGYNHVARALANDQFEGDDASLPDTLIDGQSYTYTYAINYDPNWDINNLHAIALFVNKSTGEIYNAMKTPISKNAGIAIESLNTIALKAYPNPASSHVNVVFTITSKSNTNVAIYDITGKVVATKDLGKIVGEKTVSLNTTQLETGLYLIKVKTENGSQSKRIAIVK